MNEFNSLTFPQYEVRYDYMPADPDVGLCEDYDVFVFEDGKDVTYDIPQADYQIITQEARDHRLAWIEDCKLDLALSRLED